jgi:protein-L-isoaspartate(D-aspartate) O-methyltransferase
VTEQNFDMMRKAMVDSQLRTSGVSDPAVVSAMALVERERRALAYVDVQVDLGGGRSLNPPIATGRLLVEAQIKPSDRVLLIGAATGYTAAVLSTLCAHVVAVESDALLCAAARENLKNAENVEIFEGNLATGHAAGGLYDVLLIDGTIEAFPSILVDQVREGGTVVTGISVGPVTRLSIGSRYGEAVGLVTFAEMNAAYLPGFAKPAAFKF